MNSRKVVYLFFTTLIIGSVSGAIVGFILDPSTYLGEGFLNFFFGFVWLIGACAAFSLISQAGFFAYLTIHRFGLGLFKSASLWNKVQLVIIAVILFDLFYLRYIYFKEPNESIIGYILIPLFLLIVGLIVGYIKAKETNKGAFIPAVFFIIVGTTIEWVPALTQVNDSKWLWIYFTPLLVGNIYQILMLHRLINKPN